MLQIIDVITIYKQKNNWWKTNILWCCYHIVKSNKLMCKKHDIEILTMLKNNIKTLRKTFAEIFAWDKHENHDNALCMLNTLC